MSLFGAATSYSRVPNKRRGGNKRTEEKKKAKINKHIGGNKRTAWKSELLLINVQGKKGLN